MKRITVISLHLSIFCRLVFGHLREARNRTAVPTNGSPFWSLLTNCIEVQEKTVLMWITRHPSIIGAFLPLTTSNSVQTNCCGVKCKSVLLYNWLLSLFRTFSVPRKEHWLLLLKLSTYNNDCFWLLMIEYFSFSTNREQFWNLGRWTGGRQNTAGW